MDFFFNGNAFSKAAPLESGINKNENVQYGTFGKKSHVQLCPSKGLFPISQSISWADLAAETPGGGLPDNRPTSRGLV